MKSIHQVILEKTLRDRDLGFFVGESKMKTVQKTVKNKILLKRDKVVNNCPVIQKTRDEACKKISSITQSIIYPVSYKIFMECANACGKRDF